LPVNRHVRGGYAVSVSTAPWISRTDSSIYLIEYSSLVGYKRRCGSLPGTSAGADLRPLSATDPKGKGGVKFAEGLTPIKAGGLRVQPAIA
jgi:hypothetical protein